MKIQPITNQLTERIYYNQKTFKGLWCIEESEFGEYSDIDSYCKTTKHYHPFADETEQSINDIVKEYSSPYEQYSYHTTACPEWGGVYSSTKVCVENKLPIAENEWISYTKNKFRISKSLRLYIEET